MMRLTLLGLCLSATVTAANLKPQGVVPMDEDPHMYPVDDQLVEYVPAQYMAQYQERPRYDKEVLYYPEDRYAEYKRYDERYGNHEEEVEDAGMDPRQVHGKDGKSPAIRIYVV